MFPKRNWRHWILNGTFFLGSFSLILPTHSFARDLQGRVGFGYNAQFNNTYSNGFKVPGLSVKYGLARDLAFEGILAAATSSPSNTVAAAKAFKNLFFETNLNFYSMAGLGLVNANGNSGIQIIGGLGAEFFIPGLDSLGLSMEVGGSFDNTSGGYALRTLGSSFLEAGMHFYF